MERDRFLRIAVRRNEREGQRVQRVQVQRVQVLTLHEQIAVSGVFPADCQERICLAKVLWDRISHTRKGLCRILRSKAIHAGQGNVYHAFSQYADTALKG